MGLKKEIELNNGIIVNYHRIVSINKITNVSNIIEVASYANKSKREEEQEAIENGTGMNVFINTQYVDVEYNDNLTAEKGYEHLKTLEKFEGAEDC